VTAQPALSKLFDGYTSILEALRANGSIPIVSSRTFNWTESRTELPSSPIFPDLSYGLHDPVLPFDAIKNLVVSPGPPIVISFLCHTCHNRMVPQETLWMT